jgi:hypothetical protein
MRARPRPLPGARHFGRAALSFNLTRLDGLSNETALVLHTHFWPARRAWLADRCPLHTALRTPISTATYPPAPFRCPLLVTPGPICISRPHPPPPTPPFWLDSFLTRPPIPLGSSPAICRPCPSPSPIRLRYTRSTRQHVFSTSACISGGCGLLHRAAAPPPPLHSHPCFLSLALRCPRPSSAHPSPTHDTHPPWFLLGLPPPPFPSAATQSHPAFEQLFMSRLRASPVSHAVPCYAGVPSEGGGRPLRPPIPRSFCCLDTPKIPTQKKTLCAVPARRERTPSF